MELEPVPKIQAIPGSLPQIAYAAAFMSWSISMTALVNTDFSAASARRFLSGLEQPAPKNLISVTNGAVATNSLFA